MAVDYVRPIDENTFNFFYLHYPTRKKALRFNLSA
jgi:hypothetical protein